MGDWRGSRGTSRVSLDMSPSVAAKNAVDCRNTHTVFGGILCGYGCSRFARCMIGANFEHDFFGQFSQMMFGTGPRFPAKYAKYMKLVLAFRNVLQIFNAVILFYAVLVIDFFAVRQRPNESGHHQPMHFDFLSFPVLKERDISVTPCSRMEHSTDRNLSSVAPRCNTLDVPAIAYFVQSLITDHWTPCFATWHREILSYVG